MESFGEKLNKWLMAYNLSEAGFAKMIGIPQKSINRYRNDITTPDEIRQQKINDYFNKLDIGMAPEEIADNANHDWIFDEDGNPIFIPEEYDENSIFATEMIATGREKLVFFTPDAQKYIVNKYDTIGSITAEEFEFVEKMRALEKSYSEEETEKLTEKKRKEKELEIINRDRKLAEIVEYMRRLPENIAMYAQEDFGPDSFETVDRQWDYYQKCEDYRDIIHNNLEDYPRMWLNEIAGDTGERRSKMIPQFYLEFQYKNFDAACASFGFDGDTVIENARRIAEAKYTMRDWYYLLLYARTRLYDEKCVDFERINYENRLIGWNEYKVWKMLE